MSRLYFKGSSDARKTPITSRGHERIEGEVFWGNKDEPINAVEFEVTWKKGDKKPRVRVSVNPDCL